MSILVANGLLAKSGTSLTDPALSPLEVILTGGALTNAPSGPSGP